MLPLILWPAAMVPSSQGMLQAHSGIREEKEEGRMVEAKEEGGLLFLTPSSKFIGRTEGP